MEAPADEDIVLVYSGATRPSCRPSSTCACRSGRRWNVQVLSASMVPSLAAGFGQRVDDAKGHVSFTAGTARNAGLTGVTGRLRPRAVQDPSMSAYGAPGSQRRSDHEQRQQHLYQRGPRDDQRLGDPPAIS